MYGRPPSEVENPLAPIFYFCWFRPWLAARSAAFFQRTRDDNWRDLELIAMIAYVLRIPQRQRAASVKAVLD